MKKVGRRIRWWWRDLIDRWRTLRFIRRCLIANPADYDAAAGLAVDVTLAAFRSYARQQGITGFQGSWALMQVLWTGNGWDGPGLVVRAEDNRYPQYEHPVDQVHEWFESDEVRDWLRDQGRELMHTRDGAVSTVVEHWRRLAAGDNFGSSRLALREHAEGMRWACEAGGHPKQLPDDAVCVCEVWADHVERGAVVIQCEPPRPE